MLSAGGILDLAIALNWDDFVKFGAELPVSGATTVVYEAATGVASDRLPLAGVRPAASVAVPLTAMAKDAAGSEKAKNSVVLGLVLGLARHRRRADSRGAPQEARQEGGRGSRGKRAGVRGGA